MLEYLLTTIFKLHAAFRMRSCIRILTAALLLFQLISWGTLFIHNTEYSHAISPGGAIVHVHPHDIQAEDTAFLHTNHQNNDDDSCPAMEHALRSSAPIPVFNIQPFVLSETASISQEVIAKRLEFVYLSHLTLRHAPKQSPPVI